jgi:hypothetical protein
MKKTVLLVATLYASSALAGPFAPAAGLSGSTAIAKDDPAIVGWATGVSELIRGPRDLRVPSVLADWGSPSAALGIADAEIDSFPVVSLGDGGSITLTFDLPIANGVGADFAVFENSFVDDFLELAFVEVSSDGTHFYRFPSISLTPTATQIGPFSPLDPTNLHNLAGKYRAGFGTPFDLSDLTPFAGVELDLMNIRYVRVRDVVGSIDPLFGSTDSEGRLINDPWPTNFSTGGFDLDAIAVLHQNVPEPAAATLLLGGAALLGLRRRR